jgi:hypothetical protein
MARPKANEPTPKPSITITPPGKGAGNQGNNQGNNQGGNQGSDKGTKDGILWQEEYRTPMGYQAPTRVTKSQAKAAWESGTLSATQSSVVQRGYAAYVAGGGKRKINGWFSTMVDSATGTVSPFQNIVKKYKLGGGSYTTQGDTTIINDGTTPTYGPTGYGPSGGGSPRFVGTSRADMDYFIDSTIQAAFNRSATKAEKDSFAKQYAAGERAAAKQAQTGKGKGWSRDQYTKDFLTQTLRNELGKEPDAQLLGDAGGFQDALEQYASDMGLTKTLRSINRDVIRVMKGESINDVMRDYKKEAIIMFKPLADQLTKDNPSNLTQGLKVKDILSPYTTYIEDLTDKTRGSLKLTDGIIQKIMKSDALPDMGTVNQWVRETTDFAKSTTAKKEAQDLGVSFLRAFGYGSK